MEEQLFVFTAGSDQAYQHYIDTIEEGFSLESIKSFLDPTTIEKLKAIHGNEKIKAWGALPGSQNIKNWNNMKVGARILAYRKGNYEYYATISFKIQNKDLAKHLWRMNKYKDYEETWEYIYFLEDLTEISVPTKEFNKLLGYVENYFPQGYGAISKDRVGYIKEKFLSVDGFLKALESGEWVKESDQFPPEVRKEIQKERFSKSITKTNILEANLENFLAERIEQLEEGMKLIKRQLDTGIVGRLDLLCEDKEGNMVVVELKKMKAGPSIIDQIQRYMGWIIENYLEKGQDVRGIIIVGKKDTALEYAVKANPKIQIKVFEITFK